MDKIAGGTDTASYTQLAMAYVPQPNGHMILKKANEGDDDLADVIKQAEMHGEKASEVKQSNSAIKLIEHYDTQFHKSGKYDNLADWLSSNGYECPGKPPVYAAMNTNKDAVAFNLRGEKVLGANSQFEKAVLNLAKGTGLKYDEALELALTHEYMHMAQPKKVLKSNDRAYIESGAESMLVQYFVIRMEKSKSKVDKARYLKLANIAAARYQSIKTNGYPEMNNLEKMNVGELEEIVALYMKQEDEAKSSGSEDKSKKEDPKETEEGSEESDCDDSAEEDSGKNPENESGG